MDTSEDRNTSESYNKNDVEATFLFFKTTLGQTDYVLYKGKNKLKLRSDIQNQFGLLCLNYPDVKIGEELIINLYCKKTGKNKFDLKKQGGTKRNSIALKDCIPHWANFETSEFQKLKKQFENTIITNIKGEFKQEKMTSEDQIRDRVRAVNNWLMELGW